MLMQKLGLLYVGSVDETVLNNAWQQRGSMRAYDASTAALRWSFDDNQRMGKVYSSPAVFTQLSTTDAGAATREEFIVFGTYSTPTAFRTTLLDAMVFDPANPGMLLLVSNLPGAIGLARGQSVAALRLNDANGFSCWTASIHQ